MEIFDSNETAYQKRTGLSLEKQWESLRFAITSDRRTIYEERLRSASDRAQAAVGDVADLLLLVVVGVGDGSFLMKVRERLSSVARMIVIEPEPAAFLYACTKYDLSILLSDERVSFVMWDGEAMTSLETIMRGSIEIHNVHHIGSVILPGYEEPYAGVYERVLGIMKQQADQVGGVEGFFRKFGSVSFENEMYALSVLADNSTAYQLFARIPARDVPVILAAAGPSLEHNVDELSRAKGKALIIAVAHAAKVLAAHGIAPDLVAAIDPQEGYTQRFLAHDKGREYRLLLSAQTAREAQERYRGRCIYYGFQHDLARPACLRDQPAGYLSGGSVATEIFSLLCAVGFRRFILIGQDLAYDRKGNSHTGQEKEKGEALVGRDVSGGVMGIHGEILDTRKEWLDFLHFYEDQIASHPDIHVIDATEGGALIRGTEILTLSDAIDRECVIRFPVDRWLEDLPRAQSPEEQDRLRAEMLGYREPLSRLKSELGEALDLNRRIIGLLKAGLTASPDFQTACERYDELYQSIMNGRASDLLVGYCQGLMQDYIDQALLFEQNGDTVGKLGLEASMMSGLSGQIDPLLRYLSELYDRKGSDRQGTDRLMEEIS